MKQPITVFLKIALLFLYLGYYGGITLFTHIHHVGPAVIKHSHPFSGDASAPNHSHTEAQFQTIEGLTHPQITGTESDTVAEPLVVLLFTVLAAWVFSFLTRFAGRYSLRSPPLYA